ncbi:MAG TPA: hypothetical protein VLA12_23860, partial [Planctomycetaceae bacterium]|nr:hypothetical protein [Planctomycetaceae bacterium]
YLFLFQIFDHWVVAGGLGVTTRFVLLSTLLIVSTLWIVWKVVLPWWKQIHALYAARMIEQHAPGLKSSLLNLIDLRISGRETLPHIRNALEKRSATALSHIDIEHAIDRRGLLRTSYVLLAIVILCCLYALLSPKPMSFLRPLTWADIAPATKTNILEVTPGTAEVPARVPVDIRVVVGGEPPKEVAFHYTTQDRTFVDERLLLSQIEDKPNEFQLPFAGENGTGLTQSIEYYITAGDAVSETYRLSVVLAPSATIEQIEYQYPAYTELEPRTQPTPPIDALEGTQVTVFAHTGDVPVTSAVLELLNSGDENSSSEQIPVTITDGTQLRASWKLGFRNDGTYAREYRIRCETAEGLTEVDPARYPIVIRPDIPPEVALLDPPGDLERPANSVIPLVFKARDPDFKVSYVTLRVEKDGEVLRSYPLFDGSKKVVVDRFRWELEPLRLKAGDVLTFYAEARDNKL